MDFSVRFDFGGFFHVPSGGGWFEIPALLVFRTVFSSVWSHDLRNTGSSYYLNRRRHVPVRFVLLLVIRIIALAARLCRDWNQGLLSSRGSNPLRTWRLNAGGWFLYRIFIFHAVSSWCSLPVVCYHECCIISLPRILPVSGAFSLFGVSIISGKIDVVHRREYCVLCGWVFLSDCLKMPFLMRDTWNVENCCQIWFRLFASLLLPAIQPQVHSWGTKEC